MSTLDRLSEEVAQKEASFESLLKATSTLTNNPSAADATHLTLRAERLYADLVHLEQKLEPLAGKSGPQGTLANQQLFLVRTLTSQMGTLKIKLNQLSRAAQTQSALRGSESLSSFMEQLNKHNDHRR